MKRLATYSAAILTVALLSQASAGGQETDPRLPDPAFTALSSPAKGEVSFDYKLKGYVFGLKVINARYTGMIGERDYSLYSDLRTSGLAALLKKQRLWSHTSGFFGEKDLKPVRHVQQNMDKKSRRVELFYNYKRDRLEQKVKPRFGSMGVPPATKDQAMNSDDVNSTLLKVALTGHRMGGTICNDTIPVYDGKQHYTIRMKLVEETRYKFKGTRYPALKCHAFLNPISGYDPEDLPSTDERRKPVTVYLINRPEYGLYMPVKFSYKVGAFKATVKVDKATLVKG